MRAYVDFSHVPQHQDAMHQRLRNWATWVRPRGHALVHPMFRGYRTAAHWDGISAPVVCDQLDAMAMEKSVVRLPNEHRASIQWWYVFLDVAPVRVCRELGCSMDMLNRYVIDARTMLINRS